MKYKWFLFLFACAYILDYVLGLSDVAPNIQLCEAISLGAAAVTALGALASNIFSGLSSSSISKDTRNWQHNENVYAREWQEDMYNKYQSPQALINQQLQAGVNPFISGDSVTGGNMPSASPAQAPQPPQFHFGNALGEGVQSYMQAQSIQAQNQSFQAQALHNLVTSALALTKEFGETAGRSFFETMLPQLGLDDSANATKMFNQQLQSIQLSNQRQSIENELRQKYGAKEAQAALDMIDQQITESVIRGGKMASDAKVNEATIEKMGYECGKLLAESKYFNMMSTQMSTLLPYIRSQYIFTTGQMGMEFLSNRSNFIGDTQKRTYIESEEGQSRREWNYKQTGEGNYVNSFIKGVTEATGFKGSDLIPKGKSSLNINNYVNP